MIPVGVRWRHESGRSSWTARSRVIEPLVGPTPRGRYSATGSPMGCNPAASIQRPSRTTGHDATSEGGPGRCAAVMPNASHRPRRTVLGPHRLAPVGSIRNRARGAEGRGAPPIAPIAVCVARALLGFVVACVACRPQPGARKAGPCSGERDLQQCVVCALKDPCAAATEACASAPECEVLDACIWTCRAAADRDDCVATCEGEHAVAVPLLRASVECIERTCGLAPQRSASNPRTSDH